ncbi:hypothetical protein ABVK25_004875 [Lepraria finkii]|uniref:Uncharacterized protein n=1 Tax=Lepraria finkii TaxID=1340010 RepID=A0ABR4BC96_9LECA
MYEPMADITLAEDLDPELSDDDLPLEAIPSDRLSETGSLQPSAMIGAMILQRHTEQLHTLALNEENLDKVK